MNDNFFSYLSYLAILCVFITSITSLYVLIRLIMYFIKKSNFPKYGLITLVLSGSFLAIYGYNYFHNLDFLPKGHLNKTVPSPDDKYEIRTYHYTNIFSRMARAEIIERKNKKRTTIYFNDFDYSPYVEWVGNNKVIIGGKLLDISKNEKYDFRNDPYRSTKFSNNGTNYIPQPFGDPGVPPLKSYSLAQSNRSELEGFYWSVVDSNKYNPFPIDPYLSVVGYFVGKVRPGGDWDYKVVPGYGPWYNESY